MLKAIAIAVVCLGALAVLDQEFYAGQHADEVLQMLRKIAYSFGF